MKPQKNQKQSKGTSKYALKKAQQANGNYSSNSPFRVVEVKENEENRTSADTSR